VRFIDLSTPIDASQWEPEPVTHEVVTPAQGAAHMAEEMAREFGLQFDPADLPDGELLSIDNMTLNTHTGTHVDAPSHYGTRAGYGSGRPRDIDEMPLEWFHQQAFVLDLTAEPTGSVDAFVVERALKRIDHTPEPGQIALLNTGAWRRAGTMEYFTDFVGLDASAVGLLLDAGITVIGTDAFSLDAPFGHMLRRFAETGDRSVLWPAHFAGRDREYCQIERLANLDELPDKGFVLSCFPVRIAGAGAGWARAVALLDD
jgi:cyclase